MIALRADAARNRNSILRAAEALRAKVGADALRIADVAAEAGVGAGTIYRAFGSKSGLLLAMLDERERVLQEAVIRGAPPLGPGAPVEQRLMAFVLELHELTLAERDIIVASERSGTARYESGAYHAWHTHVALLLREADSDDAEVGAHFVLAPLAAGLYRQLLDRAGLDPRRIEAQLRRHVRAALAASS